MTYTQSLFPTFSGYQAAAHALLAEHPKGMGYRHDGGVVLLLNDELCFVPDGGGLEDSVAGDPGAWEDSAVQEVAALARAELVQRFVPMDVHAFEGGCQ